MAQFTGPNLNDVQSLPPVSVAQPARAPDLSGLGNVITSEVERRKEAADIKEQTSIFGEVQEAQTDLITDFFQGGETLTQEEQSQLNTFEQLDDVARQNALQNPAVREAYNKLQRIGQARRQPKSAAEFERLYLMAADITKRIANDHPQYAEFVNKAAKQTLGFDPLERAIGLSQAEAIKQEDFERKQSQALIEKANAAGLIDIGPDGSFDEEAAKRKGQALLQQEYILKQQKDQADLLASQRLPEAEVQRQKFSAYVRSVEPMFQADIGAFGASMLKLFPDLANDPQSEAKLRQAWSTKRATFVAHQESLIVQIDDPKVQADARAALEARLKPYDALFTGDFSTLKTKTDMLANMTKGLQIELQTAAPQTARLLALGGDQVAATVVNNIMARNTNTAVQDEINGFLVGGPSKGQDDVATFTDVLSGTTTIASLPPAKVKSAINTAGAVLNEFSTRPNELSDDELGIYGSMATQLAAVAANSALPPEQLASAAKMLADPSRIRIFERYATDPNNDPATVATLATGISSVALKNIQTQARLLREQTVSEITNSLGITINPGGTFTPMYNGDTGRFEVQVTPTATSAVPSPFGQRTAIPKDIQNKIDSMNASLDAAVMLKDRTTGREGSLSDLQYKQFIADTSGMTTLGTREELPAPKEGTAQTPVAPVAPKTTAELVDEVIKLGQEGDRAAIEALLRGGQAALNPNQPLIGDLDTKIDVVASETGVDAPLLAALVQQESGGNPSARSSAGAIGLTQLLPSTAKDLGVDPNDPDQNLRGGALFLKQQLDRFGDVRKALAAYNAGPARITRLIEKFGDEWDQHLPSETENYIKSITSKL